VSRRSTVDKERLHTRDEAAAFLGVPKRTLDRWAYSNEGPRYYRVGRHARYDLADLRSWLESRAKEPERT
jgi:excisionase family DNA binding protein